MSYSNTHIHLKANNIGHTTDWYCDTLGAKRVGASTFRGCQEHELDLDGTHLFICGALEDELPLPASVHPRFGLDHFGFQVTDLDSKVRTLREMGVEILEEPWTVRPGLRMACIAAPDGVRIELSEQS